ncbi:MAG: hypothetical protein ACTHU0_17475 [Kofleriaceae bacterium]
MRVLLVAAATTCSIASAEPSITATATAKPPPERAHKQLVYGELLGRGGPYGIGWEYAITQRLALGAVGSFAVVRDQQLFTIAPYIHATLLGGKRHALFGELGFALVHSRLPSPVPEWEGMNESGAGGQATLGWQLSFGRFLGRLYAGAAVGQGGVAPFGGMLAGVRL